MILDLVNLMFSIHIVGDEQSLSWRSSESLIHHCWNIPVLWHLSVFLRSDSLIILALRVGDQGSLFVFFLNDFSACFEFVRCDFDIYNTLIFLDRIGLLV